MCKVHARRAECSPVVQPKSVLTMTEMTPRPPHKALCVKLARNEFDRKKSFPCCGS
ncbi:MAG: hypothetical protein JW882_16120 [Deltaproteobacteria bacterium]|nr:hypothetical protein [Deltaproteobacteria bacterium]